MQKEIRKKKLRCVSIPCMLRDLAAATHENGNKHVYTQTLRHPCLYKKTRREEEKTLRRCRHTPPKLLALQLLAPLHVPRHQVKAEKKMKPTVEEVISFPASIFQGEQNNTLLYIKAAHTGTCTVQTMLPVVDVSFPIGGR
jgi:hypothetical protein